MLKFSGSSCMTWDQRTNSTCNLQQIYTIYTYTSHSIGFASVECITTTMEIVPRSFDRLQVSLLILLQSSQSKLHNNLAIHQNQLMDTTKNLPTLRQACFQEKPGSAICVQSLDDSRGFAIRITYRISLRSSSMWQPRHPSLKVVLHFQQISNTTVTNLFSFQSAIIHISYQQWQEWKRRKWTAIYQRQITNPKYHLSKQRSWRNLIPIRRRWILDRCGNDPSAGSPTETLLRLHLPLNDKV